MIYLIYSQDKDIIRNYLDNLIDKEKINPDSVIKYELNNDSINSLIEECSTIGLFSLKKFIIVDATDALSSKGIEVTSLTEYLDNYNKDIILVFVSYLDKVDTRKKLYKKISSIGKVESLIKDNNYLFNYVKNKLNGYKIDTSCINYFINKVGTNIGNIDNEIEKLINYKYEAKEILKQDIDLLVEENIEEEIFSLTDAIVKNDQNKAIKLYQHFLLNNVDVNQMIALFANQFRFLLQVKLLYDKNKSNDEIAKILSAHPYRVKLAVNNCYSYRVDDLKSYLVKLYELDKKIKLSLVDKKIFLELFMLNKDI